MAMIETATEIATEAGPAWDAEAGFPPHRMTIDRYERLVEAGVYGEDDPVFLWHGRLVEKMPKGRPHAVAQMLLFPILYSLLPEDYHVEQEAPLAIGDDSMPEPDLVVIRGSVDDHLKTTPTSKQAAIVIEVSDSSLAMDSRTKLRAYAAESIPVYWIVNIPKGRVSVYSQPTGPAEQPAYLEYREYGPGEEIPVVLDGQEVGRIAYRAIFR